ncbi:hypothetical protein MIND_00624000 [Mycena indigotica]|uniref:Uncharacterized protein n=1 Tax=Mycena indigotica TaxID=2126181 RepID=A0A8H6SR86_9AGAR|nr:uncharacterized protein MIND_00624000 [Mycena indigotica]KAF7303934.1 hypothetical protein MIND_00624000 [Mycena indigotica]
MLYSIPLVYVLALASATSAHISKAHNSPLAARDGDPSSCVAPCNDLSTAVQSANGAVASLCSQNIVSKYASCYNCEVKVGSLTQAQAQEIVDTFVKGCTSGGHTLKSVTISGGSSSGGSGASGSTGSTPDNTTSDSGSSGNTTASSDGKTGDATVAHASTLGLISVASFLSLFSFGVL